LYWLWSNIVGQHDLGWIDREISSYEQAEARKTGRGDLVCPHVPVLRRLLSLGVSREELTALIRQMEAHVLSDCCVVLDCISLPPKEVPINRFGVFEMDESGRPMHRVGALHESFWDFDNELRNRRDERSQSGGRAAS
jgi:hypothetical protein